MRIIVLGSLRNCHCLEYSVCVMCLDTLCHLGVLCVFVPLTIRVIGHHAFAKIVQPRFFYLNRAIYTRKNKTRLK